jgi:hypothetical protein
MTSKQLVRVAVALAVALFLWGLAAILRGGSDEVESMALLGPFVEEQVDRIEFVDGADTISVERSDQGWRVDQFDADPDKVQEFFTLVATAVEGDLVARSPASHARMGVADDAAKRLRVYQDGKQVAELIVGNNGRVYRTIYVRLPGEDGVYLVEGELRTIVTRSLKDWRDKRIVDIPGTDIHGFEFVRGDTTFGLRAQDSVWVFTKGEPTDSLAVARFRDKFNPLLAQGAMFATPAQVDSTDFAAPDRELILLGAEGDTLSHLLFDETASGAGFWVRYASGGTVYHILTYKGNEIVPLDNTFRAKADSTSD